MSDDVSEILDKYPITNTDWQFNRSTASLMTYIKITTNSVRLNKASLKITLDLANRKQYFFREIYDLSMDKRQFDPWNRIFPSQPGRVMNNEAINKNIHINYTWDAIINHEGTKTFHYIYTTSIEGIKILCIDRLTDS